MQFTLDRMAVFSGTGLHSGLPACVRVHPAPAGHGIVFCRADLPAAAATIPARWDHVVQTALNTRIVNAAGAEVGTIEHLMAALAGLGLTNARIDIDGAEVPILDGSAAPFVRGLLSAGIRPQDAPLRVIEVLHPVEVARGDALARLSPATAPVMDFTIDFADAAIGRQQLRLNLSNGAFLRELCDSRTFCRAADVDAMRAQGLALGGTPENAVVVDGDRVLSPGGLRHPDEPVRHKMLDALGDLATAGAPILGLYTGVRAGHALTNALLRALFDWPDAWRWREATPRIAARLPGAAIAARDLTAVA